MPVRGNSQVSLKIGESLVRCKNLPNQSDLSATLTDHFRLPTIITVSGISQSIANFHVGFASLVCTGPFFSLDCSTLASIDMLLES